MRLPSRGHPFVYHIIKQEGITTSPFEYPNSTMDYFLRGLNGNSSVIPSEHKKYMSKEYGLKEALSEPNKWFEHAMEPVMKVCNSVLFSLIFLI